MMRFGRTRFYADENIENALIGHLRDSGFHVDSAVELGLAPRDDRFHLQEAVRRKGILLTRDLDFLSHRKHPFHKLKKTGTVVLSTDLDSGLATGYALLNLIDHIGNSGTSNVAGLKVHIQGDKMTLYAVVGGAIRTDTILYDSPGRLLFQDSL
jgi:predicted nuclease of predicted toxin-antitoxin system